MQAASPCLAALGCSRPQECPAWSPPDPLAPTGFVVMAVAPPDLGASAPPVWGRANEPPPPHGRLGTPGKGAPPRSVLACKPSPRRVGTLAYARRPDDGRSSLVPCLAPRSCNWFHSLEPTTLQDRPRPPDLGGQLPPRLAWGVGVAKVRRARLGAKVRRAGGRGTRTRPSVACRCLGFASSTRRMARRGTPSGSDELKGAPATSVGPVSGCACETSLVVGYEPPAPLLGTKDGGSGEHAWLAPPGCGHRKAESR